jgi:acyl-coenzyme A synthetase/AMP-(fatty) acid ligase
MSARVSRRPNSSRRLTVCAIGGIFHYASEAPVWQPALERMSAVQRYRGPDGTGIHVVELVVPLPAALKELTREILSPDGALLTPNLGRLDDNGMLYLLGRIDEVINRGGEKVSPEEVEGVLCRDPAVGAAAVFAAPGPAGMLGEAVRAMVVCRLGAMVTAQELVQHAAARLEPCKVPHTIEFAERLPRALLGKVRRRVFREGERPPEGRSGEPVGMVIIAPV